jgi:hypothetical protein
LEHDFVSRDLVGKNFFVSLFSENFIGGDNGRDLYFGSETKL